MQWVKKHTELHQQNQVDQKSSFQKSDIQMSQAVLTNKLQRKDNGRGSGSDKVTALNAQAWGPRFRSPAPT